MPYVCTLPNIVLLYVDVCKKLYLPTTAVFKNNITGFIVLSRNLVPYEIKYSNLGKFLVLTYGRRINDISRLVFYNNTRLSVNHF